VLVHKANLTINSRTTILTIGPNGREKSIEGTVTSLFNANPERNKAMIAMLAGEVACDRLTIASKSSEWESKQGVTFICRGGIPPEIGDFDGYVAVGWKKEPTDLTVVKTRINLASSEMSQ
jgi:hypothetical protein